MMTDGSDNDSNQSGREYRPDDGSKMLPGGFNFGTKKPLGSITGRLPENVKMHPHQFEELGQRPSTDRVAVGTPLPRRRRLYLAGPMQGIEDRNHPAFHTAARELRESGYDVISPAEYILHAPIISPKACMKRDVSAMTSCDDVAVLPGWENSWGANIECDLAEKLTMQVETVTWWLRQGAIVVQDTGLETLAGTRKHVSMPVQPPFDDDSYVVTPPGPVMLSELTLRAVQTESARAHAKHHRPDEGSGSLFDPGLTLLARLAALIEEVGEVAEELHPAAVHTDDERLFALINNVRDLGTVGRSLTYDHGGPRGLVGGESPLTELPDTVDQAKLVKELIQVANVVLSWVEYLETPRQSS